MCVPTILDIDVANISYRMDRLGGIWDSDHFGPSSSSGSQHFLLEPHILFGSNFLAIPQIFWRHMWLNGTDLV